jgi:hypothetical protein
MVVQIFNANYPNPATDLRSPGTLKQSVMNINLGANKEANPCQTRYVVDEILKLENRRSPRVELKFMHRCMWSRVVTRLALALIAISSQRSLAVASSESAKAFRDIRINCLKSLSNPYRPPRTLSGHKPDGEPALRRRPAASPNPQRRVQSLNAYYLSGAAQSKQPVPQPSSTPNGCGSQLGCQTNKN